MERDAWGRQLGLALRSVRVIDASARPARGVTWGDVLRQLDVLGAALESESEPEVREAVRGLDDLVFVPVRGSEVPQPTEPPPVIILEERIPKLIRTIGRLIDAAHG